MKKNTLHFCTWTFVFITLLSFTSNAQWSTHGPYGGPVNAMEAIGTRLFSGTSNGVFSSADNGTSWNFANTGIERRTVSAMASNASGLMAGLYDHGAYYSSDEGASWTPRNNGLGSFQFTAMFSASDGIFAATNNSVFFSSDNGLNWSLASSGIPFSYSVYSFAEMGDTVYAGSYSAGLFRSNNNGSSWTSVPDISSTAFIYALASDGNNLYAGTSEGVYRSTNRGLSFSLSNTGFPPSMWAKAFAVKPGYVFAGTYSEGMFVSTDQGSSWTAINNGIPDRPFPSGLPHNYPSVNDIAIMGSNVVAATEDGNYLSSDNGATWTWMNDGILGTNITSITSQGALVFAGTDRNGVYKSNDNGLSWTRNNTGLSSWGLESMSFNGSSVFAGTIDEMVFRSDDLGLTWVSASSGLPHDAKVMESNDSVLLAITAGGVGTPSGLYRSTDGATWSEIPSSAPGFLASTGILGTRIFGANWVGGFFYTDNDGSSWTNASSGIPNVKITSIIPGSMTMIIGTEDQGIYRTTDGGSSWTAANSGLSNLFITDLDESAGTVYASTWGGGVFYSNDNGLTWMAANTYLDNLYVRALTASAGLHAATDAGVFSSPLLPTAVEETAAQELIRLFPNPSDGRVYLQTDVQGTLQLEITDLSGKVVYRFEGASENIVPLDLRTCASGIYFLNARTDKGSVHKKLCIE